MPIGDFKKQAKIVKAFKQKIDGKKVEFGVCMMIRQALNKKEMTTIKDQKEVIDKIFQPFNEYMKE